MGYMYSSSINSEGYFDVECKVVIVCLLVLIVGLFDISMFAYYMVFYGIYGGL